MLRGRAGVRDALFISCSVSGTANMLTVMQLLSIFCIWLGSSGSFHHMRSELKASLTTSGSRWALSVVRKKPSRNQERGLPSAGGWMKLGWEPMLPGCYVVVGVGAIVVRCLVYSRAVRR